MRVLITGIAGFVGTYLAKELKSRDYDVWGSKLKGEKCTDLLQNVIEMDITDENSVINCLEIVKPDVIFHLAAQSSVAISWKNPQETFRVNATGVVNLLECVRKICPDTKILLIGSSEEYGMAFKQYPCPSEDVAVMPQNIYAVTKVSQNMLGKIYSAAYNMHIIMTRSFNHIGSGQSTNFVVSDFCKQAAEIEKRLRAPVINVGNLAIKRDFTDVRDVVAAYRIVAEKGADGETYNIGSGKVFALDSLLKKIIDFTSVDITVNTDIGKLRPIDVPEIKADINKISAIGWKPCIDINESLQAVYEYWLKES